RSRFSENRRKFTKSLQCAIGPWMLISRNFLYFLFHLDRHRNDLVLKTPFLDCYPRFLLADQRKLVLLFSTNRMDVCQLFRRFAHQHVAEWIVKTVAVHRIDELAMPQPIAIKPRLIQQERNTRHAFDSANQHTICLAKLDRLRAKNQRLQSGSTSLVYGKGGNSIGEARTIRNLSRGVWTTSSLTRMS